MGTTCVRHCTVDYPRLRLPQAVPAAELTEVKLNMDKLHRRSGETVPAAALMVT